MDNVTDSGGRYKAGALGLAAVTAQANTITIGIWWPVSLQYRCPKVQTPSPSTSPRASRGVDDGGEDTDDSNNVGTYAPAVVATAEAGMSTGLHTTVPDIHVHSTPTKRAGGYSTTSARLFVLIPLPIVLSRTSDRHQGCLAPIVRARLGIAPGGSYRPV